MSPYSNSPVEGIDSNLPVEGTAGASVGVGGIGTVAAVAAVVAAC